MKLKLKAIRREGSIDQDQDLNHMIATNTEEADQGQDHPLKGEKEIEREKDMRIQSTEMSEGMTSIARTSIEADMKVTVIDLPLLPIIVEPIFPFLHKKLIPNLSQMFTKSLPSDFFFPSIFQSPHSFHAKIITYQSKILEFILNYIIS